jgi:hypothetical protein
MQSKKAYVTCRCERRAMVGRRKESQLACIGGSLKKESGFQKLTRSFFHHPKNGSQTECIILMRDRLRISIVMAHGFS